MHWPGLNNSDQLLTDIPSQFVGSSVVMIIMRDDISEQKEFREDGIRSRYDRKRFRARNINFILQRVHGNAHIGLRFLQETHRYDYVCGKMLRMDDERVKERLFKMHSDGSQLACLYAKSHSLIGFIQSLSTMRTPGCAAEPQKDAQW